MNVWVNLRNAVVRGSMEPHDGTRLLGAIIPSFLQTSLVGSSSFSNAEPTQAVPDSQEEPT